MASPSAQISGIFEDALGNPIPNITVIFTLMTFKLPRNQQGPYFIAGTAVLGNDQVSATTDVNGQFVVTVIGNDAIIVGSGSYWAVTATRNGDLVFKGNYQFLQSTNYNLLTAAPLVPFPPANPAYPPQGLNSGGNNTFTGTNTFTNLVNVANLENIRFADQFPGATADAQIANAIAALGSTGGTVDCRGYGATTQTIAATCLLGYTTETSGPQGQLVTPSLTFLFDPATTFVPNSTTLNMFQIGNNATVRDLNIDTSSQVGYSGYAASNIPMTITGWNVDGITVTMDATATGVGLALISYENPTYGQSPSSIIYAVTKNVTIYAGAGATGILMTQVGGSTSSNGWFNANKFYDVTIWGAKYGVLMASNGGSNSGGTVMANNEFYGFEYEAAGLTTALAGIAMTFVGDAGIDSNRFEGAVYDLNGASFTEFGPLSNNSVQIASGGHAAWNWFYGQFYYNYDGTTVNGQTNNTFNDGVTGVFSLGSYLVLSNNIAVQWRDTSNAVLGGIVVGSDNNLYIQGSANSEIVFQPKNGTNAVTMTDGNLSVFGSATETFATLFAQAAAGGNALLQLDSPSGQQSIFEMSTATVLKWQIGKQTDDSFFLFDSVNSVTRMSVVAGGALSFLEHGVLVGAPTGGDQGAGTINVSAGIYLNGTAYTNPDYALEHWATGKIEKFSNNKGAKGYVRMTLDEVESYARVNFQLPRIANAKCIFERADIVLEKIEEIFTHLFDLRAENKAMKAEIDGIKTGLTKLGTV